MEKINWQNLPSTATPLNSTNLNKLQDNVEDAIDEAKDDIDIDLNTKLDKTSVKTTKTTSNTDTYSCNYINELDNKFNYSTTEQEIGMWGDKKLYRKLYIVTNLTFNTWTNIPTDNSYQIKKYDGYYHRTNNRIDGFLTGGSADYDPLIVTIRSNALQYRISSDYSADAVQAEFIIEYTKN